jgi:PAS domain S-box-containing protein
MSADRSDEGVETTAALLRAVTENVADGLYVVDAAERITYANPAAVALLGYDGEAELLGRPSHATIHHLRPDGTHVPVAGCPLLEPLETGETVHVEDDWFVRRDGSFLPVAYSSAPLELASGRGAVVAFRDTSARRELEEERAHVRAISASRARLSEAADEARRQVERDLHDGAQQRFVTLALRLGLVRALLEDDPVRAAALLEQAQAELHEALGELRELAQGIHPAILRERGLEAAARTLARRSALTVEVAFGELPPLPATVESTLYFVVAEALTNAAKHARASAVEVRAERLEDGRVRVCIDDDGIGGLDRTRGSGLTGLADRVEALGGELVTGTGARGGAQVCATVPLDASTAAPET